MVVLLGSKNKSKYVSLELALKKLGISEFNIMACDVNSGVNSKPIGFEIIRGANNRNSELKDISLRDKINYDYLCSIEGGYEMDENGLPFIVTYTIIEDRFGNKSTGKSLGLRLTRTMYRYLREGHSLNKVIEEINNVKDNKKNGGITGYLTNGLFDRSEVDKDAIISAFSPLLFKEKREILDNELKLRLKINN